MRTDPQLSTKDHIARFRDYIAQYDPMIQSMDLLFYQMRAERREAGRWVIPASALGDEDHLAKFLDRLFAEGRFWVDLAGQGRLDDTRYLVVVEYSEKKGLHMTSVVLGGPPYDLSKSHTGAMEIRKLVKQTIVE